MIIHWSSCPYCEEGVIGLDCDKLEIVFNPDRCDPSPCPHLAALIGFLSVNTRAASSYRLLAYRSDTWLYVHQTLPLQHLADQREHEDLQTYLQDIIFQELPHPSLVPPGPYCIMGGRADERTVRKPDTGFFELGRRKRTRLCATFDAWSFYSPHPGVFGTAIPGLLAEWDRLLRDEGPEGTTVANSLTTEA